MEVRIVSNQSSVDDYIRFIKKVYKGNVYYRDTMSVVLKDILKGKAEICKSSSIIPLMIIDSGEVRAVGTYAIVDRMKDKLQLTYFEALENSEEAVDLIIEYGRKLAKENNIRTITAGFNFHVNYILGLLANKFDEVQSFGNAYNPPYYIDYLKKHASREINLNNYVTNVENFELPVDKILMKRVTSKFTVRKMDFKNLEREAEIYTDINNRAFSHHDFYYERRVAEDLELFSDFKLFLREENLLFLECGGRPIGFMLWYPDFNELLKPGESLGIKTFIKNKLFSHKIKRLKLVEIGVLPEYQGRGAVLALFNELRNLTRGRYEVCETGWIMEGNIASKGFGIRWADSEYKQYKVFLIDV